MTTLLLGQAAPDFNTTDQDGKTHTLSDYRGQWLLIYFYPKDNTPGCTAQACSIRDAWGDFEEYNTIVLGVSKDSGASHQKFIEKQSLPFNLLADTEQEMMKAYDVWSEKSMFGKKYMGTVRTSFLINPDGKVVKIYDKVNTKTHAEDVLIDIKRQQEEKSIA